MPRRKAKRTRILWTAAQEKQLRRLSGRWALRQIARELRRSESAVTHKAHKLGISLALKGGYQP
jgi:hypothetical protein